MNVNRASKLDMPRWAKPLISTSDGLPLMAAGQDGDRRVVILPFDLGQSTLPYMSAFPILTANLINYLSPPGVVQSADIQTGAPETLSPLPQVERVRVAGPDQRVTEFRGGQGAISYSTTDVPGLYRVQQLVQGGQQTVDDDLFAANLANPAASDIRPRLTGLSNPGLLDAGLTILQRELWAILAAILLPLLLFEWFWFHRRV